MIIEKIRNALPGHQCHVSFPEEGKLMLEVREPVLDDEGKPMNRVTRCGGPFDMIDEILANVVAAVEANNEQLVYH